MTKNFKIISSLLVSLLLLADAGGPITFSSPMDRTQTLPESHRQCSNDEATSRNYSNGCAGAIHLLKIGGPVCRNPIHKSVTRFSSDLKKTSVIETTPAITRNTTKTTVLRI